MKLVIFQKKTKTFMILLTYTDKFRFLRILHSLSAMNYPVCVPCQLSEVANKVNICVQILIAAPRLSSFCDTRPIKPCATNCLFTSVCFLLLLSKTQMADSCLYAEHGFQLKVCSLRQDRVELELSKFKAVHPSSRLFIIIYLSSTHSTPPAHPSPIKV